MRHLCAPIVALAIFASPALARAQGSLLPLPEEKPIRGATFPGISPDGKTLAFSYLGDLWTVPAEGGAATRLTIHDAHDGYPRWSPDGKWIAFASDRYSSSTPAGAWSLNYDIFVIPSTGGEARRITSNTANDYPNDWSPDGTKILYQSMRDSATFQYYSIDVKTGVTKQLTSDEDSIRYGVYSPDGKSITYDRSGSIAIWWRPKYHGSANMEIYSKELATGKITRVTNWEGQDLWPMYSRDGRSVYYVSDQATPGAANIVRAPAGGGKPEAVTHFKTGAVRWPNLARNGESIAFEYMGDLYTVPATGGQPKKLRITAVSDDKQNNMIRLALSNGATEVEISPDGKTLAFVARGDIWTIPADRGGEAKRLTNDPANDYDISWSPDSKKLAFASDRNGNFDIFTIDVASKELKTISADGNDENSIRYAPDGKSIAFLRSGAQAGLYVAAADGSAPPKRVAASEGNNLFARGINSYSWSPDSKWLAYSRRDPTQTMDVWVVSAAGGQEHNVTYYPGANVDPEWTKDGKYLVFASDRERPVGVDLYSLPLEKEKEESDSAAAAGAGSTGSAVKIDFDDIENRSKRITTQGIGGFSLVPDGKTAVFISAVGGPPDYWAVPVRGGTVQRLTSTGEATGEPKFSDDAGRFYALGAGGTIKWMNRAGGNATQVAFTAHMDMNRRAEVHQAFNEFWRRLNVGFYDPKMHGVDWRAIRAEYEPLLEGVGTREDFWYLLSEMVGELNASHSEPNPAPGQPGAATADLGITFDQDYAGPGLKVTGYMPKGPNDDLGPRIKPSEYVLQIDGQDVVWNEAMYDTLLDKTGKTVELLVNDKPTKDGARTVKLKAISHGEWANLEYERKVRTARDQVEKLSNGRLAYIHIKGMDQPSLRRMERELWGKAREADGLILDIRNNGGGNTHDEILSQLSRVVYGYVQPRDAPRSTQPFRHWDKPIVLLINENSASDAEIFPYGFRALKLGKIVGVTTPGYVIGTFEGTLADGTQYRIPTQAYYGLDGKDMENNGVRPDITVEQTPEDISSHNDRQLQAAVDTLLKELPKRSSPANQDRAPAGGKRG